jgi:hypothetical protein
MKVSRKFNKKAIAGVELFDFKPQCWVDSGYFYDEERKAWYHRDFHRLTLDFRIKENIEYVGEDFVRERMPSHKMIKDNKVGDKPHVIVHLVTGHKEYVRFDTFEAAKKFYASLVCDTEID